MSLLIFEVPEEQVATDLGKHFIVAESSFRVMKPQGAEPGVDPMLRGSLGTLPPNSPGYTYSCIWWTTKTHYRKRRKYRKYKYHLKTITLWAPGWLSW